jgi:anti-sigma regulatory factor (Ser/Thr protein kinase)
VRELALHILDILQNTVEAGATRVSLTIDEDSQADRMTVEITDNGRGMDAATLAKVVDPFYTSRKTRNVGLGLPLWAAAAERAGGRMTLQSQPGAGTTVRATFQRSHPDRQPLGDIPGTLLTFLLAEGSPNLRYAHRAAGGAFEFDTADIRQELGEGLTFGHPAVRQWLGEFLREGEQSVAT